MDFQVIATQEEFDARIGERLKREREKLEKQFSDQYAGYVSADDYNKGLNGLNEKLSKANKEAQEAADRVKELEGKVQEYETNSVKMRIARDFGMPYEMCDRLRGDNEEALRADAEALMGLFGQQSKAPAATSEPIASGDGEKAAYRQLLNDLNLGGK